MLSGPAIAAISIAAVLVVLCICLKCLTTKYIRGDFSKDEALTEEEEKLLYEPSYEDDIKKTKIEETDDGGTTDEFDKEQPDKSSDEIIIHFGEEENVPNFLGSVTSQDTDEESNRSLENVLFISNAILKSVLQFNEVTSCIKGEITSIEGLNVNSKDAPHDISFHLKVIPKNRFRIKTRWRTVPKQGSNDDIALTFTLGPVSRDDLMEAKLGVKVYGKKASVLANPKFYAGCYISLGNLAENDEPIQYSTPFLPKGAGKDSIYLTSESETE